MVFCDDSHTPLSQWMEFYDSNSGIATILLEIPSLGASSTVDFWLYMGISDLSNTERDQFMDRFAVMNSMNNCDQTYLDNWLAFDERYPCFSNGTSVLMNQGASQHVHSLVGSTLYSVNDDCSSLTTTDRSGVKDIASDGHSHSNGLSGSSSVASGNDVLPESFTLSFCRFGYVGHFQDPIPINAIAMFESDASITGWSSMDQVNGLQRYIRGGFGPGNVRQDIGANSHYHTISDTNFLASSNEVTTSETPKGNPGGVQVSETNHQHNYQIGTFDADPSPNEPSYCNYFFQKFTFENGTKPFPGIILMQSCEDNGDCADPPIGWELVQKKGYFPRGSNVSSELGSCVDTSTTTTSSHDHFISVQSQHAMGPFFKLDGGVDTTDSFCLTGLGLDHTHTFEGYINEEEFLPDYSEVRYLKRKETFETVVTITGDLGQFYSCDGSTILNSVEDVCSGNGTCIDSKCVCSPGHCGSNCEFFECDGICQDNSSHVCFGHGNCIDVDTCDCEGSFEKSENCEHYYCFGIEYDEPLVCGGNGTCDSLDHCTCDPGYTEAADCSVYDCFGIIFNDTSSVCGGAERGVCNGPNNCDCTPGYFGDKCNLWECDDILFNDTVNDVCSGHGNCTKVDYCVCDDHYYPGEAASSYCQNWECFGIEWGDELVCSGNGTCEAYDLCSCEGGTYGYECDMWNCNGVPKNETSEVCFGHGVCNSPEMCICEDGYYGEFCGIWNCSNIPMVDPSVCNYENGTCSGPDTCTCSDEGYYGGECQFWECDGILSNETDIVCSSRGSCNRPDLCVCEEGYYPGNGVGKYCDLWNCSNIPYDDPSVCNFGNGTCSSFDNCTCEPGYYGDECENWNCNGVSRFDTKRVCSMNGVCVRPEECICDDDILIAGEYCQFFDCFGIANNVTDEVCSSHGDCLHPDICVCSNNYTHAASGHANCSSWKCFGMYHDDDTPGNEGVCHGYGNCTSPNTCECLQNYTNPSCGDWTCFEKLNSDPLACFDKGECVDINVCNCTVDGWSGDECNTCECFGTVSTDPTVCAGHGTCVNVDKCSCIGDYFNNDGMDGLCDSWYCGDVERRNTSDPMLCNSHGSCDSPDECSCTDGYTGNLCETWKCGLYYYDDTSVCAGKGTCDEPNQCTCVDVSEEDHFGYFGSQCEIKFGKRFVLATKSVLAVYFEMKTNYLQDYNLPNLDTELEGEFECSNILEMDSSEDSYQEDLHGDLFRNCSISRINEFSAGSGSTLYLKVFVDHFPEEKLLKIINEVELDLLVAGEPFTVDIYPSVNNIVNSEERFTMKLFKGTARQSDDTSSSSAIELFTSPTEESEVCKSRLQIDEQCIQSYECYQVASDLADVKKQGIDLDYTYFSIGYLPSLEDMKWYFTKFYFESREACELGMGYEGYKRFSLVSCHSGQKGNDVNFQMYDRCQNELVDMFFNSRVLTYFLMTSSPMYLVFICCGLFVCCCSSNVCIFCIRGILIKIGVWEKIMKWRKNKVIRDSGSVLQEEEKHDVGFFDDIVGVVTKDEELEDLKYLGYSTTTAVQEYDNNNYNKKQETDVELEKMNDNSDSSTDDSDSDEKKKEERMMNSTSFENIPKNSNRVNVYEDPKKGEDNIPGIVIVHDSDEDNEEEEEYSNISRGIEELDIDQINEEYLEANDENHTDVTTPLRSAKSSDAVVSERSNHFSANSSNLNNAKSLYDIEHLKLLFHTFENEYIKKKSRERGESECDIDPRIFGELRSDFTKFQKEAFHSILGMMNTAVTSASEEKGLQKVKSSGNVKIYEGDEQDEDNTMNNMDDDSGKRGVLEKLKCLMCWIGCCSCCCFHKFLRPCISEMGKCWMMVMFILIKEGFALWFSSSEFLSSQDIDTNNPNYILLVSIMNLNQYIIWASILLYLFIFLLLILIFVERFFLDPLMFCVAVGSLREYVYFRIFKSMFLLWFICINLFCYITKFAYLDSNEQYNSLVSPMFYFSIVFPEALLIFSLFGVLSYNGVSSHAHLKRFKSLGIKGLVKFPKVNISAGKCGKDVDQILEDFFQLIFLLEKKDAYRGEMIVKQLSQSNEYGHLSWEFLDGLDFDQIMYLKEFFFPKEFEEESYMTVFHHHRIWSKKWILSVLLFPFLCLFGYTGL